MFSKEELLTILQSVNDPVIIEKINSMLFINKEMTKEIIKHFKDKGLLKIEKSNDKNEYYIHLEEDKICIFNTIEDLTNISFKFKTDNTLSELNPVTHESIKEMWWHRDMIQVWTREDVCLFWKD